MFHYNFLFSRPLNCLQGRTSNGSVKGRFPQLAWHGQKLRSQTCPCGFSLSPASVGLEDSSSTLYQSSKSVCVQPSFASVSVGRNNPLFPCKPGCLASIEVHLAASRHPKHQLSTTNLRIHPQQGIHCSRWNEAIVVSRQRKYSDPPLFNLPVNLVTMMLQLPGSNRIVVLAPAILSR